GHGIFGRGIGRGNLYGAAGRIQSWKHGGQPCLPTQEKYLWPQTSSTRLESTNSALPQVNQLRSTILGSLRLHQQDDEYHHCNVGGRSNYFRQEYGQHQRAQGSAKRRIRDEGPWRTQIFPWHPSTSRQGTKNYPHQPGRIQSND